MAIQSFQLDPEHTHEYRRPKELAWKYVWEELPDNIPIFFGNKVGFLVELDNTSPPE